MRVLVHDRTEGLPSRLIDYSEQRLQKLSRHFDRVVEAEVEFDSESRRSPTPAHSVRITVRTDGRRHPLAHAHERGLDARGALDLALDKIDRQVVRLKEKIKIERKRSAAIASDTEPVGDAGDSLVRVRLKLRPESIADAEAGLESSGHPCYVFLDEESGMVNVCFRRGDGGLTVIEAVVP